MKLNNEDLFLEKYLEKYDKWLGAGEIPYASRVVPVRESLEAKQWVMPNNPELCYGCGLCVDVCPEEATILKQQTDSF